MLQRVSPIIATIRPIGNMAPFLIAVNSSLQRSSVIEIGPTLRVFVATILDEAMGVHEKRNRSASPPGVIRPRSTALESEPPCCRGLKAFGRIRPVPRAACPFRS